MYPDLPAHLQTLNSIPSSSSPPSSAWNQEEEEGLWSFLRTDDIFGPSLDAHQPSPEDENKYDTFPTPALVEYTPNTPITNPTTTTSNNNNTIANSAAGQESTLINSTTNNNHQGGISAPTLESFLAAFANSAESVPNLPNNYLLPLPLPYPGTGDATANSVINTADVMQPLGQGISGSTSNWGGSEYGGAGDDAAAAKRLKKMGAGVAEIEEDKRRRNTEASARFRLKKKEREQALERRAKELETQVSTLQTEKSALQSENKLLKYLLLKTGTQPSGAAGEGLSEVTESLGKRKRVDA